MTRYDMTYGLEISNWLQYYLSQYVVVCYGKRSTVAFLVIAIF